MSSGTLIWFVQILLRYEDESLATRFFEKLATQVGQLPVAEVPGLWLPFLRSFLDLLKVNNITLITPRYRNIFAVLLCTWLRRFVGEEPRRNTSLVRPTVPFADIFCYDCDPLNRFLADGLHKAGHFKVNQKRRAHLHQQFDRYRIDVSHVTERTGSPQTLVVTKTDKDYSRKMEARRQRIVAAKFDRDDLRAVLGPRLFPLVMDGQPVTDREALSSCGIEWAREAGEKNPAGARLPPPLPYPNGTLLPASGNGRS